MSTSSRVLDRRHERRSTSTDRRSFSRVGTDVFVNRFVNGHPYLCRMTDISRTGARLVPLLEPRAEAPRFMGIQFQLPGQTEICTASGETMSLAEDDGRSRSVGIRFTNLPPQSAWAIEAFLKAA